ncbi:MAG: zinc ribbon domain-containing protein [Deltaproteobacteria bacterium]|nr:zinc ribbon domain-containing protein [Deltaproteobacteria bacterium]
MQCVKCKETIPDEARFCPACGHRFSAVDDVQRGLESLQNNKNEDKPSFALIEKDFLRALSRAADEAGVPVPDDVEVVDPNSLQQAGEQLGLDKLKVQQA